MLGVEQVNPICDTQYLTQLLLLATGTQEQIPDCPVFCHAILQHTQGVLEKFEKGKTIHRPQKNFAPENLSFNSVFY